MCVCVCEDIISVPPPCRNPADPDSFPAVLARCPGIVTASSVVRPSWKPERSLKQGASSKKSILMTVVCFFSVNYGFIFRLMFKDNVAHDVSYLPLILGWAWTQKFAKSPWRSPFKNLAFNPGLLSIRFEDPGQITFHITETKGGLLWEEPDQDFWSVALLWANPFADQRSTESTLDKDSSDHDLRDLKVDHRIHDPARRPFG